MLKCALCSNNNAKEIQTKVRNAGCSKITVFACEKCGVHFLEPMLTEEDLQFYYLEQYRKEYTGADSRSLEKQIEFHKDQMPEAKNRIERVAPFLEKSDSALEIGCATGYFLEQLRSYVHSVQGTEWDEVNADFARNNGFDIRRNAEDFPDAFNKIFLFHVLEHVKDPISYLTSLKGHLSEDSMLFIEVPNNTDALSALYDLQEFKDFYYCSAHLWYFNHSSLEYTISQAGYSSDIAYIQRYDISNHIRWIRDRKPGGQSYYNNIFSQNLIDLYSETLIKHSISDTLFAVCRKQ